MPWVLYSVAQNLISYPVQVMLMPVLGYEMGNFGQALILVPQQFTFVLQVLLLAIIFTIGGLLGRLKNLENKM